VNAQSVTVGGIGYLYDHGVFWMLPGPPYVVVTPPLGAVVAALPAAAYPVHSATGSLFYYFGGFYEPKGGAFEVVRPPAGTLVSYLPDGYQQEQSPKGGTLYTFGPMAFKPVFVQGVLVYRVAER
jgi:hypothetical protein